jgi:hypothetical protein
LPHRETCQQASFLVPHSLSGPTWWVGLHRPICQLLLEPLLGSRIVAERAAVLFQ